MPVGAFCIVLYCLYLILQHIVADNPKKIYLLLRIYSLTVLFNYFSNVYS